MMEGTRTSETSLYVNESIRRYIPEGCSLFIEWRYCFVIIFATINSRCGLHSLEKYSYNLAVRWRRAASKVIGIKTLRALLLFVRKLYYCGQLVHINSIAASTAGDCRPQESIIVGVG
jgi:hypothetical protein